jgi:hypothetical protein
MRHAMEGGYDGCQYRHDTPEGTAGASYRNGNHAHHCAYKSPENGTRYCARKQRQKTRVYEVRSASRWP